jgi:organic radical activating enzyme
MWVLLTEDGIRQILLADLKFHTSVKGWICNTGNYVYNLIMDDNSFVSNTICRAIDDYPVIDIKTLPKFNREYAVCPKENCYCGMDIGIPKGKTIEHVLNLKQEFNKIENVNSIPWYNNETILAFGLSDFLSNRMVHVDWFLGKRCNFDCVYCSSTIHDNHSSYPSLEKLVDYYNYLTETITTNEKNRKTVSYIFGGGEPTLIPNYLKFLEHIKNDNRFNSEIRTLTNLTVNADKLYKLNQLSDITFSVHLAYITEKFTSKIERFLLSRDETSKSLTVKFMYDKHYNYKINDIVSILKKYSNLNYNVTPLHNKSDKKLFTYDEKDKEYFQLRGKL